MPVQTIVATYIMWYLSVYIATCTLQPNPSAWELDYAPREPFFTSQDVINIYTRGRPLHLSTTEDDDKPYRTRSSGWEAKEDVKGKPGYIATTVGASVTWTLPSSVVQQHMTFGRLHVVHLKSYAHMGLMQVDVVAVAHSTDSSSDSDTGSSSDTDTSDSSDSTESDRSSDADSHTDTATPGAAALLKRVVVDSLWDKKGSEPQVAEVRWEPHLVQPGSSLQITVTVIQPGPDSVRSEHKIKLVELVLY